MKDGEDLNEVKDSSMPICHLSDCDADESDNETAVRFIEMDGDIQITCSLISIGKVLFACQTNAIDCSYSYFGVAVPAYILA